MPASAGASAGPTQGSVTEHAVPSAVPLEYLLQQTTLEQRHSGVSSVERDRTAGGKAAAADASHSAALRPTWNADASDAVADPLAEDWARFDDALVSDGFGRETNNESLAATESNSRPAQAERDLIEF